jgi:hypothetical protein
VLGIDCHRCDRRENAIGEISFEPRHIGGEQRGTIDDQNTFGRELVAQGPPALLLIARELRRGLSDPCQKLGGRQAVHGGFGLAGLDLLDETGDADHEELVKIAGGNRQETQSLKERMHAVGSLLQNASIEREPGKLAIDEALRIQGNRVVDTIWIRRLRFPRAGRRRAFGRTGHDDSICTVAHLKREQQGLCKAG